MIVADVALDEAGLLKSCSVSGHAGAGPRGGDVVCAAVSVLARTALRTLSLKEGVRVRGTAPARGEFGLETERCGGAEPYVAAVTAFLVEGLRSIAEEYPDHCTVRIREERRQDNGS